MKEEHLKLYDELKDLIRFISISNARVRILISLNERPQSMSTLRATNGLSASTVSHNLTDFEKRDLIFKEGEKYFLSPIGKIVTLKLIDLIRTLSAVKKFKKLWLNHDIDAIPPKLLQSIGDLYNSIILESEPTDLTKVHDTYIQKVMGSRTFRGISPFFHRELSMVMDAIVANQVDVQLIVARDVLDAIIATSQDVLDRILPQENFSLWVLEEVKVGLTITDYFISIGLYKEGDQYDFSRDLYSESPEAISWGNKLFTYYLGKAQKYI